MHYGLFKKAPDRNVTGGEQTWASFTVQLEIFPGMSLTHPIIHTLTIEYWSFFSTGAAKKPTVACEKDFALNMDISCYAQKKSDFGTFISLLTSAKGHYLLLFHIQSW